MGSVQEDGRVTKTETSYLLSQNASLNADPSTQTKKPLLDPKVADAPKAGSVATVFSIWNTMVGSTLLAIPWAFRESGLVLGLLIYIGVLIVSYYTCTMVVKYGRGFSDFSDVCVTYLGKWAQALALLTSVIILVGASIAYHVFMKDSLYSIVNYFRGSDTPLPYWNPELAALGILLVVFPLVNFKTMNFLVRINSFGTVFVVILMSFVLYACTYAFIYPESTVQPTNTTANLDLQMTSFSQLFESLNAAGNQALSLGAVDRSQHEPTSSYPAWLFPIGTGSSNGTELVNHLQLFSSNFAHLIGVLSLSFFIHNAILPILKNARQPEKSNRNALFAYLLAAVCYAIPGVIGVIAFRFAEKMEDNFLNQFPSTDILANIARFSVLLQLVTIYPLLLYIIRSQVWGYLKGSVYPGFLYVFLLNVVICGATTSVAAFYPSVGTVLRYTGAICGLVYLYILPISVHLSVARKNGKLSAVSIIFHSFLVLLGLTTLVLQFIPVSALL